MRASLAGHSLSCHEVTKSINFFSLKSKHYRPLMIIFSSPNRYHHSYVSLSESFSFLLLNSALSRLSWQRTRRSSKRSIYNINRQDSVCVQLNSKALKKGFTIHDRECKNEKKMIIILRCSSNRRLKS